MFCMNCGNKMEALDQHCGQCGQRVSGSAESPAQFVREFADSSAFKGFLVLLLSFFTMPFRTMRMSARLLREIGAAGALDEGTETPHLHWQHTASPLLASIAFVIICLGGIYGFFRALEWGSSLWQALIALVGAYLVAVVVDWLVMILAEYLTLAIGMSRDLRTLAGRDGQK